MKNNIQNILLSLILLSVSLTSCFRDKGNYDYENRPAVGILEISNYSRILGRDTITIKPTILQYDYDTEEFYEADPADYEFKWIWMSANVDRENINSYVISEKPFLDKHPLNLPGNGDFDFYLKITDKNGIDYFSNTFKVMIESNISRGIMLMSDVDNSTRLDYINFFDNMLTPIVDLLDYAGVENVPFLGKPYSLALFYDGHSPYTGYNYEHLDPYKGYCIGIMTEYAAIRFHYETLEYTPLYDMENWFTIKPELGFHPTVIHSVGGNHNAGDFFAYDQLSGNLYYSCYVNQTSWSPANYANKNSEGVRFNTSPIACPIVLNSGALYDDDSKSFVKMKNGKSNYYGTEQLKNIGLDLVALNSQPMSGNVHRITSIMKNAGSGKFSLYQFDFEEGKVETTAELNLPDEAKATDFSIPQWTILPFIYYRTDTKVYCVHVGTRHVTEVYEAPQGHKISLVKFLLNSPGDIPTEISSWRNKLVICTYDPAAPAESCGTFGLYTPIKGDGNGNIEIMTYNDEQMRWSGFGKIVDVASKQK